MAPIDLDTQAVVFVVACVLAAYTVCVSRFRSILGWSVVLAWNALAAT